MKRKPSKKVFSDSVEMHRAPIEIGEAVKSERSAEMAQIKVEHDLWWNYFPAEVDFSKSRASSALPQERSAKYFIAKECIFTFEIPRHGAIINNASRS